MTFSVKNIQMGCYYNKEREPGRPATSQLDVRTVSVHIENKNGMAFKICPDTLLFIQTMEQKRWGWERETENKATIGWIKVNKGFKTGSGLWHECIRML